MSTNTSSPSNISEKSARNAVLIATFLAFFLTILTVYFGSQGLTRIMTWEITDYLFFGSLITGTIVATVCAWFSRKGYIRSGMLGLIFSFLALLIISQFFKTGDGLLNALIAMILAISIAIPTLSGKWLNLAVIAGAVAAGLIILIDLFGPAGRQVYTLTTTDYMISVVLSSVLLFLAIRGFKDYALRTKLIAAFLAVALLPLGILFFLNDRAARQNLTNDANIALSGAAAAAAKDIDEFIFEGLTGIRMATQSHVWKEYLALSPAARPGSETEEALYTDLSALASRDSTFIDGVGLMDKDGIDVADTATSEIGSDKSTHRYIDEPLRTGLPFTTVQFSPTTNKLSLYFSAPVRDANGDITGVLRIRYNAAVLQQIVTEAAGHAGLQGLELILLDENHIRLAVSDAPELILKSVVPLSANTIAQLQAERRLPSDQPAEELSTDLPEFEEGLNNAASQPIFDAETKPEDIEEDTTGETAVVVSLDNRPWLMAAAQQRSIYLAPLATQTRTATVTALIIAALVAAAALVVSQSISRPIGQLTAVAQQIAGGDLSILVSITSKDEIGSLALTFNSMTTQLRDLIGSLEERVSSRTRAIQTSAEIGRRLSAVLNQGELVRAVVEQLQKELGYYHVHIYLFDKNRETLQMAGGSGDVGLKMLKAGHSLPVGKGLVGRAAHLNMTVFVPNVSQEANWLPNPLLPETKSEVAVPIALQEEVLGVIDVQQNTANGLSQADADLIASVASQVAVALQNARLFAQVQRHAEQQARLDVIGQQIQSARSVEEALKITVRELGRVLGTKNTRVSLESPESAVKPNPK